jgi:hypothetical protein
MTPVPIAATPSALLNPKRFWICGCSRSNSAPSTS